MVVGRYPAIVRLSTCLVKKYRKKMLIGQLLTERGKMFHRLVKQNDGLIDKGSDA